MSQLTAPLGAPSLWRRLVSFGPRVGRTHHHVRAPRWTAAPLRLALLADLHVGAPWVRLDAVSGWVADTNALRPDIILILGDILPDRRMPGWAYPQSDLVQRLSGLEAPLGVHTILGNHDWFDDPMARAEQYRRAGIIDALAEVGLPPLRNTSRLISRRAGAFWLVGFDSQRAPLPGETTYDQGRHAPDQAFASVPVAAPTILMAHEPDYFAEDDPRPALQVSGHTHAGQVNLLGWRPLTPSRYGGRYAHGLHHRGEGRLVTSGGMGYTAFPLRIGAPPEIVTLGLTGMEDPDPWTT